MSDSIKYSPRFEAVLSEVLSLTPDDKHELIKQLARLAYLEGATTIEALCRFNDPKRGQDEPAK